MNPADFLKSVSHTVHLILCYFTSSLSSQHSLTYTADLVLERLTQKVSALTAGSEQDSTKDTEEKDAPVKKEESTVVTP